MGLKGAVSLDMSQWTWNGMEFGFGGEDKRWIGADALGEDVDR